MTDRGLYRSIRCVLLDGPDFQLLPERARWAFIVLKITFGPSGIEVWYPGELLHRLAALTGATTTQMSDVLSRLESAGWIRREGNVFWIVGQLDHEPGIKQSDWKHRRGIQRHVCGLPHVPIVREYVEAHRGWFTEDGTSDGTPSEGLAWAFEGPSMPLASREKEKEKEKEKENEGVNTPMPLEALADEDRVLAHYVSVHRKRRPGERERKIIRRALKEGYSAEDLCEAIDGNARDAWAIPKHKHELSWTLRDNGHIDNHRAMAMSADASPIARIPGARDGSDARKLQLAGF